MMFCPKCGSLLKPKKEKEHSFLFCSCGYKKLESQEKATLKEKTVREKETHDDKSYGIVINEENILPLTDVTCPKCGHPRAHYWSIQTRAGDEGETNFFRCEKCKHTWREYK